MFISTKKYKPGDVILRSESFVHIACRRYRRSRCNFCFSKMTNPHLIWRCLGCKGAYYCSRACQEQDLRHHHQWGECEIYMKHKSCVYLKENMVRFLLRLYLTLQGMPSLATKKFRLPNGTVRCYDDLLTHEDLVWNYQPNGDEVARSRSDYYNEKVFKEAYQKLFILIGNSLNAKCVRKQLMKKVVNTFAITDDEGVGVGVGLYIEASIFNHSCVPNAAAVWNGTTLEVRAMKTISEGEEVFLSYLSLTDSFHKRQKDCVQRYFFECHCSRCSVEKLLSPEALQIYEERLQHLYVLQKRQKELENQNSVLSRKQQENFYYTSLNLLNCYRYIYGKYFPFVTTFLVDTLKKFIRLKVEEASRHLNEINFLRRTLRQSLLITHGKEHPLFIQFENDFELDWDWISNTPSKISNQCNFELIKGMDNISIDCAHPLPMG